jgi:phosphatidylglycerophosphatase A
MKTKSTEAAKVVEMREPVARAARHDWAWGVSTVLGIGHAKPGPGTWGSAVTVAAWYGIARAIPAPWHWPAAVGLAALVSAVGIPAATREARRSGDVDPSHVVVDEVAGQLIALIGAPVRWKTLLAGFILFRVFDILKPPPLRRLERVPEGAGIVLDDLGAGAYALAIMQILLRLGWLA